MRKEGAVTYLRNYPRIYLKGQRRIMKTFSHDTWCRGRNLNPGTPEYEAVIATKFCEHDFS
jgi:hypothetical protein